MSGRSPGLVKRAFLLIAAVALAGPACGDIPRGAQRASFRTEDGFRLSGTIFGGGSQAVVLSHMFPADQSSWFGFAGDLADRGYRVLAFDFRGYGDSEGEKDVGLFDRDVRAAARYLTEERRAKKVALIGASMGGTASLIAAASTPVAGVATLSAPVRFRGLDASAAVGRVKAPAIFIAARGDDEAAKAAETLFREAGNPHDLAIVAGGAHGTDLLEGGDRGDEIASLLDRFLDESLR